MTNFSLYKTFVSSALLVDKRKTRHVLFSRILDTAQVITHKEPTLLLLDLKQALVLKVPTVFLLDLLLAITYKQIIVLFLMPQEPF